MKSQDLEALDQLIDFHKQHAHIHAVLSKPQPVAIAREDQFWIYDFNPDQKRYYLIKKAPVPMPIPQGVRAAFQLEAYHSKTACVVTEEVFEDINGYVTILHEFVHCSQFQNGEQALKKQLKIAQKAQKAGDVMWEIQHPFPYDQETFIRAYADLFQNLESKDRGGILAARKRLEKCLPEMDFEYLIWQEWKEGFARWIENQLQKRLGIPINTGGRAQPFKRVSFYAGGAGMINWLHNIDPEATQNLNRLFNTLKTIGGESA